MKVENKMPQFKKSAYSVLNDALREGARDTLINAKEKAPFKKGDLRSETELDQKGPLHWRVSFFMEYARFQELGGDEKRRVRNYSTAGTGKGFLKKAGDEQAKKIRMKFKKHAGRTWI